ncbi:hypothetical protein MUU46_04515 [Scandinavium sp. TWS1a]|uniref:LuxR C-terminal-related transcriptional regulator n=1 Tax=Scandinavium tedordense TaxID=2926521 RepID=UPI0021654282|nr:hypothetical protein [Scandinavium tedordense]MCS2169589.1 hypothetical protein [Scandinavium tedordense]
MGSASTFISDNAYFCIGVSGFGIQRSLYIGYAADSNVFKKIPQEGIFIILVEDLLLRGFLLSQIALCAKVIVVLDSDLLIDSYLKLHNFIYVSHCTNLSEIEKLISSFRQLKITNLSSREMRFLSMSHLSNKQLAIKLSVSEKTCSAYRVILQKKLSLKFRNNIAMGRIRRKASIHYNALYPSGKWSPIFNETTKN